MQSGQNIGGGSKAFKILEGEVICIVDFFFFKKSGPTPASVRLFLVFSSTNFTENTLGFIRIQTRIVEGEHADHLTTTTALSVISCIKNTCPHCATILLGTFNVKHTLPKT